MPVYQVYKTMTHLFAHQSNIFLGNAPSAGALIDQRVQHSHSGGHADPHDIRLAHKHTGSPKDRRRQVRLLLPIVVEQKHHGQRQGVRVVKVAKEVERRKHGHGDSLMGGI